MRMKGCADMTVYELMPRLSDSQGFIEVEFGQRSQYYIIARTCRSPWFYMAGCYLDFGFWRVPRTLKKKLAVCQFSPCSCRFLSYAVP
jgi:hypothetical protein